MSGSITVQGSDRHAITSASRSTGVRVMHEMKMGTEEKNSPKADCLIALWPMSHLARTRTGDRKAGIPAQGFILFAFPFSLPAKQNSGLLNRTLVCSLRITQA